MTYVPTPLPPPTELYTPGIYILQHDNQQIIGSGLTPFEFRTGTYEIDLYPEVVGSIDSGMVTTASNNIDNLINTYYGGILFSTLCFCTLDNPTGNLFPLGMTPYSIYQFDNGGDDWNTGDPFPQLNDWTLIASLSTVGAGTWFTCLNPIIAIPHKLIFDGIQLVNPPISASLSGSYGFVQITASNGTYGKITLTCVETSSTDPVGGKWIISNTATLTKLY